MRCTMVVPGCLTYAIGNKNAPCVAVAVGSATW